MASTTSRSTRRILLALFSAGACAGFLALGHWQLQRRQWKHALIARVEAGLRAAPLDVRSRSQWQPLAANGAEYRRLRLHGRYRFDRQIFVHAASTLGTGYWVMTPLRLPDGSVILVNRGFVPSGWHAPPPSPGDAAPTVVEGLLRQSRPHEGWFRRDDPARGYWVDRDVAAICRSLGLRDAAPFFVDRGIPGETDPAPAGSPVGGLTVLHFPDNHLVYALTWYGLAAMSAMVLVRIYLDRSTDDDPDGAP